MNRLLAILTARWLQAVCGFMLLAAVVFRSKGWWIVAGISCTVVCLCWLWVGIVGLYRVRGAWRGFPETPEYREYAEKQAQEQAEKNKNKSELK